MSDDASAKSNNVGNHLATSLQQLEDLLGRLPGPVGQEVRKRITELRSLLAEQRPPRFAVVGRRGSGKSSLINALFGAKVAEVGHERAQTGQGRWLTYEGPLGSLELLDTRGLQEGSAPVEADDAGSPLASILREVARKTPDTILFLIRASDVDSAVDEDLRQLARIGKEIERANLSKVPIVAVITHCDTVEPKNVRLHAPDEEAKEDLDEKTGRIRRIERLLEDHIRQNEGLKDRLVTVIGISAYQSFRNDGTRRADERWRVEDLVTFLFHELPDQARVELARFAQVRKLQAQIANRLTLLVAGICAAVAATPIPVADIIPITSLQVSLVTSIGYVSGREMTAAAASEFLVAMGLNVGAGFALREAARALVKFVFPGGGLYVSALVAYAGTMALGKAAVAYFIEGAAQTEAKKTFAQTYDETKASGPPAPRAESPTTGNKPET